MTASTLVAVGLNASPAAAAPSGFTVEGLDTSNHDGTINWSGPVSAGVKFGWAKAVEGTGYVDPYFSANYQSAKNAGLYIGAYSWGRPDEGPGTGKAQADFLVDHAQFANDGRSLPPQLDIEWPWDGKPACYGLSTSQMVTWLHDFMNEVKARTGREGAIYTNLNWWNPCTGNDTSFGANPLEIANYSDISSPPLPAGWSTFAAWQYAGDARSRGLPGSATTFNGTLNDLAAFANGQGGSTPPPPPSTTGYGITKNSLQVGMDTDACRTYPSGANCSPVVDTINIGDRINPICQKTGQTVGSNPYWVYGTTNHSRSGWIPSWWIDYPDNVLPNVPICTGGKLWVDTFATADGYNYTDCLTNGWATRCKVRGELFAATNYVFCKRWGDEVSDSAGNYNHWWLKTDLDTNAWGSGPAYVSAYYLSRWGNDVAKDNNGVDIPNC